MSAETETIIEVKPEDANDSAAEPKKSRRWLLFGVIALAIVLLLLWYLWTQTSSLDGLKRFVRYSGKRYESFSVRVPDAGACVIADDCLCTASQEGLSIYRADGKLLARADTPWSDPTLKAAGDRLLCYEIGGYQLSVYKTNGKEVFSLHTDGRIYDAEIAKNGAVCVLTEGDGSRAVLQAYSKNGDLLFRHESKSRYLNACALSPDAEHAAATALGQEDVRFASAALLFETDSADAPAELSLDAQMIYDVAFLDGRRVCAVGESSLQFFTTENKLLREYPMQAGSLSAYRFTNGRIAAAYDLYAGGTALVLLDAQGKELSYLELDDTILHLSLCGDYLSVLTERELRIYDRSAHLCGRTENPGWKLALVRSDGTAFCLTGHSAVLYIP